MLCQWCIIKFSADDLEIQGYLVSPRKMSLAIFSFLNRVLISVTKIFVTLWMTLIEALTNIKNEF